MQTSDEIKKTVKEKYGKIAEQSGKQKDEPCCALEKSKTEKLCCESEEVDYSVFSDDYSKVEGYLADADLGLGCGLPTAHAGIKAGDTVLDLGSGAGNDVFVARALVGDSGKVIGVDMTEEMIAKAEENNQKLGYTNVEFRFGEIEDLPANNATVDVVISNCVLNLVPDKNKAFREIYRVLKPGAHFCVSDVVYQGEMSEKMQKSAELYAGCVAGAMIESDYIETIRLAGFNKIEIKKKKVIDLPDDLLESYLDKSEIEPYRLGTFGLFSITLVGYKF
ncbi:MAG: arsenite methyltransferase [Calditrichota bacterium]